ncbi:MAG: acyltransferase [Actinomycetota bacterium]|nr:acyltransferase [Actinomycetota bacterium]
MTDEDWRDPWKLGIPGHPTLRALHETLRSEIKHRWDRSLPFADELFDRWERARFLGFGAGASIYDSSVVIGDVRVGEETWVGPFTVLDGSGGLTIGRRCSISAGVQLYSHDSIRWSLRDGAIPAERQRTNIGDNCYLGPMSVVSKGVTIGDHTVVGAHSFVREDIPPFRLAVGVPAKVVGRVELSAEGGVRFVSEQES